MVKSTTLAWDYYEQTLNQKRHSACDKDLGAR